MHNLHKITVQEICKLIHKAPFRVPVTSTYTQLCTSMNIKIVTIFFWQYRPYQSRIEGMYVFL